MSKLNSSLNNFDLADLKAFIEPLLASPDSFVLPPKKEVQLPDLDPVVVNQGYNIHVSVVENSYTITKTTAADFAEGKSIISNQKQGESLTVALHTTEKMGSIRHTLCSSVWTGVINDEDCQLQDAYNVKNDLFDVKTPDLILSYTKDLKRADKIFNEPSERLVVVMEFCANYLDSGARNAYDGKVEKYSSMLKLRSADVNCRTVFYVMSIGPNLMYHNFPQELSLSTLRSLKLAHSLGNLCYNAAITNNIFFFKGSMSEDDFRKFKETFKRFSETLVFPSEKDPAENDNVRKIRITQEFLDKVDSILPNDDSLNDLYAQILKNSIKRTTERLTKSPEVTFESCLSGFMKAWLKYGFSKKETDRVNLFPCICKSFEEPTYDYDDLPIIPEVSALCAIWRDARSGLLKNGKAFQVRMSEEEVEILSKEDDPRRAELHFMRKEEKKRFEASSLSEEQWFEVAKRGVEAKQNFPDNPVLESIRREKQLPINPDTSTKPIDRFLRGSYNSLLVGKNGVPCWWNLPEIRELKKRSLQVSKSLGVSGGDLFDDDLFEDFMQTDLFGMFSFNNFVFEELNGNFNTYCKNKEFLLLNICKGCWVVCKATGSGPDSHMFYSVLVDSSKFIIRTDIDLLRQPKHWMGSWAMYDFISVTVDKMDSFLSLDIACYIHHVDTYMTWGDHVKKNDFLMPKPYTPMAALKILMIGNDARDASKAMFQIRYPSMESFSGNILKTCNKAKIFEKLEPPRTLFALWATERIIDYCKSNHRAYIVDDKSFSNEKSEREEGLEMDSTNEQSGDLIIGLENPWFPELAVSDSTKFLDTIYIGHLKNKHAIGYNQAMLKCLYTHLTMENKIRNCKIEELGCFDEKEVRESYKYPSFSAYVLSHAGFLMRQKLSEEFGPGWQNLFWESLYKNNKKETFVSAGTMKASTKMQDWAGKNFAYDKDWDHDKSTKVVEAICNYVIPEIQKRSSNPSVYIIENIEVIFNMCEQVYVTMFPKRQPGTFREISIMDIISRLLQLCVEPIFKTINTFLRMEMISKDQEKSKLTAKHRTEVTNFIEEMKAKYPKMDAVTLNLIGDLSKWGPGQLFKAWVCILKHSGLPREVVDAIIAVLNKFTNKKVLLPKRTLDSFDTNISLKLTNDDAQRLKEEFLGLHDEFYYLLKAGAIDLIVSLGMFQGVMQKGSSLYHTSKGILYQGLTDFAIKTWQAKEISRELEGYLRKEQERVDKLNDENLKKTFSTGERFTRVEIKPFKVEDAVGLGIVKVQQTNQYSSDDFMEQLTLILKVPREKIHFYILEVLLEASKYLDEIWALIVSESKTSDNNQMCVEFCSDYRIGKQLSYARIKFVDVLRHIIPSESLISRQNSISNSLSACLENGCSFYECNQLQIAAMYQHYRMMGCNISQFFKKYAERLLVAFHPAFGGFCLQPAPCAGLLGFNHAYFNTVNNSMISSTIESYLCSAGLEYEELSEGTQISLSIKSGGKQAFDRFCKLMDPDKSAKETIEKVPQLLYLEPKNLDESKLISVVKSTGSQMRSSFASLGVAKVHTYCFYLLWAKCVTYTNKSKKDDKGKLVSVKKSLLDIMELSDLKATKIVVNFKDVESLRFPMLDAYKMVNDIIRELRSYKPVRTSNLSRRDIVLTMYHSESRLVPLKDIVLPFWFGKKITTSVSETEFSKKAWRSLYPWLDFDGLDGLNNTLRDGPFTDHVSLSNFIRSTVDKTSTIRLCAPVRYGLAAAPTINSAIKRNFSPGYKLAITGVEIVSSQKSSAETKITSLSHVTDNLTAEEDISNAFNFTALSLAITSPGSETQRMKTVMELMKDIPLPDVKEWTNYFTSLNLRGQFLTLVQLFLRESNKFTISKNTIKSSKEDKKRNLPIEFLDLMMLYTKGNLGYWSQFQSRVIDKNDEEWWEGEGTWVGLINEMNIIIRFYSDQVYSIEVPSSKALFANLETVKEVIKSLGGNRGNYFPPKREKPYNFYYDLELNQLVPASTTKILKHYIGVYVRGNDLRFVKSLLDADVMELTLDGNKLKFELVKRVQLPILYKNSMLPTGRTYRENRKFTMASFRFDNTGVFSSESSKEYIKSYSDYASYYWVNRKPVPSKLMLSWLRYYSANASDEISSWLTEQLKIYMKLVAPPISTGEGTFTKSLFKSQQELTQEQVMENANILALYKTLTAEDSKNFSNLVKQNLDIEVEQIQVSHRSHREQLQLLIASAKKDQGDADTMIAESMLKNFDSIDKETMQQSADLLAHTIKQRAYKVSMEYIALHPFFQSFVSSLLGSKNDKTYREIIMQSKYYVEYNSDDIIASTLSKLYDNNLKSREAFTAAIILDQTPEDDVFAPGPDEDDEEEEILGADNNNDIKSESDEDSLAGMPGLEDMSKINK